MRPPQEELSAPARTRTWNIVIKSHALCQLSYGGLIFGSNVGSQRTLVDSRLTPESLQFLASHCILLQLSDFRKSFQGSVLRAFFQVGDLTRRPIKSQMLCQLS